MKVVAPVVAPVSEVIVYSQLVASVPARRVACSFVASTPVGALQ